jgi:hypothetical protein
VQVADVIEEDHAGVAGGVGGLAEEGSHDGVVAARFVNDGGAEVVEMFAESGETAGDGTVAEVGTSVYDDSRGFAAGMGIHNADFSGTQVCHWFWY